MAKIGNVNITFDIESITKTDCISMSCVNHLQDCFCCNNKRIEIDDKGQCKGYQLKTNARTKKE
jgi:hypothetical protein